MSKILETLECSQNKSRNKTNISKEFVVCKRSKKLLEIVGAHTIKNAKVFKIHLGKSKGKCEPFNPIKTSLTA